MIRQYRAQTSVLARRIPGPVKTEAPQIRCGTVDVGTIVYIQDGLSPFGPRNPRYWSPVRRTPYIVECWHNREYSKFLGPGQGFGTVMMTGGHLATVRNLRNGRRSQVSDWILAMSLELAG